MLYLDISLNLQQILRGSLSHFFPSFINIEIKIV